jgi:glycerol kinase
MPDSYVLALDQGTTSSRAVIYDQRARVVASAQQEFRQILPASGLVEHDPGEIWESQIATVQAALREAALQPSQIHAIGIANQRETAIVWDRRTGEPLGNAIVWQDRRTAAKCDLLRRAGSERRIRRVTGLLLDPYFSATKFAWLLEENDARVRAERGDLCAGTVDSWLIYRLTGGRIHLTDFTNACRTSLLDIEERRWSPTMLDLFGVPAAVLPEVQPSSSIFAYADTEVFGAAVPIAGVAGDQQSALFGQGCHEAGTAKNTYGTGCFLLMDTGDTRQDASGLLTSLAAWPETPHFVTEGSVFIAGAVVQWLRDGLGFIERSEEVEALAASVPNSGGVHLVPAFTGLGAPHWDPYARGLLIGLGRDTTRAHIARAALEGIALQTVDLVEAMEAGTGTRLSELHVDGGASRNDLLMQIQADLLDRPVVRPANIETTALGAAFLAGLATGVWASPADLHDLAGEESRFEPAMPHSERERLLEGWRSAVERSKAWERADPD